MVPSFGIAKVVADHPAYNLGIALPFICAFYLLNSPEPVAVLFGYKLGTNFSAFVKILSVTLYYAIAIVMLLMAAAASKAVVESRAWLIMVIVWVVASVFGYFTQDEMPIVGLFFGALSLIYLLLVACKMENGALSLALVNIAAVILSVTSFTTGILWFNEQYLFKDAVALVFGFSQLSPESLKVGAFMLVTSGYSMFYAVFETGKVYGD